MTNKTDSTYQLVLKHSRPTRWLHWINFPLITLMIWSGLLIYWSNDVYRIGIGKYTVKLFPESFYIAFSLDHRLAEGLAWHFFLQWFFILNGIGYVTYTIVSGKWRQLVPNRRSFPEAWQTILHDLHLSQKAPPARKFNGAQQLIYTAIILCGGLSVLTGFALYKPIQLSWLDSSFGGYEFARYIHFWLTMGYIFFFFVHILQVARAGWNNFRSMISGHEIKQLK